MQKTINITVTLLFTMLISFVASPQVCADNPWQDDLFDNYGLEVNGFVEARGGVRLRNDPLEKDYSIAETRLQLDLSKDLEWGILKFKGDLYGDQVTEKINGQIREANLVFSPIDFIDLKAGRQILTWGTGDLIFINDMFPKDWQSFFIGRNDEYLKAPSDALKMSIFLDQFDLDLVYTPVFDNSIYVSGERLSFYNSLTSSFSGRDSVMADNERNSTKESEFSARASKSINGTEIALYGYSGFWKEPEGFNMTTGLAYYPRLSVYGVSARAQIWGGIGNVETGYYDSRQNRHGNDPTNRNSEVRFMAGFEKELGHNLTGAVQYYLEWMQDYNNYEQAITAMSPTMPHRDKQRHMLTMRLTKLTMQQNLNISLFSYYSPSDKDGYFRPKISYRINDNWQIEGGGNFFWGQENHTFWGRFKKNSNLFTGLRYSF